MAASQTSVSVERASVLLEQGKLRSRPRPPPPPFEEENVSLASKRLVSFSWGCRKPCSTTARLSCLSLHSPSTALLPIASVLSGPSPALTSTTPLVGGKLTSIPDLCTAAATIACFDSRQVLVDCRDEGKERWQREEGTRGSGSGAGAAATVDSALGASTGRVQREH
jgi:hypothetical protein